MTSFHSLSLFCRRRINLSQPLERIIVEIATEAVDTSSTAERLSQQQLVSAGAVLAFEF